MVWALPGFAQKQELGAKLPEHALQVAKHRFRVNTPMEAVLKFYATTYPPSSYARVPLINQPHVRAFHIKNPKKGPWAGINLYETQGEVRIFVVPADPSPPVASAQKNAAKPPPSASATQSAHPQKQTSSP